jgi:large subunit ribosomal protein L23
MKVNNVLLKPILTEKGTRLASMKTYAFVVNPNTNKNQIAKALESLYGVKVASVRVATRPGKVRRAGKRMTPKKQSNRKIAYITVKEGKIDLFPQA